MQQSQFDDLVQGVLAHFPDVERLQSRSTPDAAFAHLRQGRRYVHLSWEEADGAALVFLVDRDKLEEPEVLEIDSLNGPEGPTAWDLLDKLGGFWR